MEVTAKTCTQTERSRNRNKSDLVCEHCSKVGNNESSCFLFRKYFTCQKMRHISRFCPGKGDPKISSGVYNPKGTNLSVSERIFSKIAVGGTVIDMLYDKGSMYTMIKRELYDKLQPKPALVPLDKCGIEATGHKFIIDGVAYLNLKLKLRKDDRSYYNVEYEPVFVSGDIMEYYYGMCTEKRFDDISRNHINKSITCTPSDGTDKVSIKYYVVKEASVASIKVARTTVIPERKTSMIKGKV